MTRVELNQDAIDKMAADVIEQKAWEQRPRIEAILCPVHGKPPTNFSVVKSREGTRVVAQLHFDPCCEAHAEAIRAALA